MARIVIAGGTGYAGSVIAKEAAARGHQVTAYSRKSPADQAVGVAYVQASVEDAATQYALVSQGDVIVSALAPRGDMAGKLLDINTNLAKLAAQQGRRLIVIGGFGSLRPAPGAPRIAQGEMPPEYAAESREMMSVLEFLLAQAPSGLDWIYVSPAMTFGGFNPGERTGQYSVGGDVVQFGADGKTHLSGADFALAIVDEIEKPAHHCAHISLFN